jgi:ZIP family zinc transporter
VLLSNLPEGMASTPGFVRAGWPASRVLGLWLGIAFAGGIAAGLGYAVLGDASDTVLGVVQSFAAGTILTMLASVMMPTAYKDGKQAVGLAFVLGFALLSYLTTLGA